MRYYSDNNWYSEQWSLSSFEIFQHWSMMDIDEPVVFTRQSNLLSAGNKFCSWGRRDALEMTHHSYVVSTAQKLWFKCFHSWMDFCWKSTSETTLRQEHTKALLGAGVSHSDGFAFDAQRIRLLQATSDLDRPGILSLAAAFRPGCRFMFFPTFVLGPCKPLPVFQFWQAKATDCSDSWPQWTLCFPTVRLVHG